MVRSGFGLRYISAKRRSVHLYGPLIVRCGALLPAAVARSTFAPEAVILRAFDPV